MRTLFLFVAGVLLSGLSMACSSVDLSAKARSEGEPEKRLASKPLRQGWKLGTPISFEKMTIHFVTLDESINTNEFITLDEGLRSGTVVITEIGANGQQRTLRRGQQVSDNADVNKLALTNKSGKLLILIAGEIVVGGKQDRIVGHDCIVASSNSPVLIDVFCVEHGRWDESTAFGQSRSIGGSSHANAGGGSGNAAGRGGGGGGGSGMFAPASAEMAAPKVRENAQAKKSQSGVWKEVAGKLAENNVSNSTGTLNSVFEDKQVSAKLEAYVRAFKDKHSPKSVGVIAAVDGTVISADVFASTSLFQTYWPKLLRSYALEAINAKAANKESDGPAASERFLAQVEGTTSYGGLEGVYRLTERQSETEASFELECTTKTPLLIHFNRVKR